jgi:hypothetical protein
METKNYQTLGDSGNPALTNYNKDTTMKQTLIPGQLHSPDFRFVPLRPKGQLMGKDKNGNEMFSTGKEPAQA